MTRYPSPWPAALATMFAALLVGGGTILGVILTLKSNSAEKKKDRIQEANHLDWNQRVSAFADYMQEGTSLYLWAKNAVDRQAGRVALTGPLPAVNLPRLFMLDSRVNLLAHLDQTRQAVDDYGNTIIDMVTKAAAVTDTVEEGGDVDHAVRLFESALSACSNSSIKLSERFREELHSDN